MAPGTKVKIAFAAAGGALMIMAGGAVFTHTYALSPIIAWAGDRNDPADALLWLEDTREAQETTTWAEYRNARNLARNRGMLEEYAGRVEGSAARGTRATTA